MIKFNWQKIKESILYSFILVGLIFFSISFTKEIYSIQIESGEMYKNKTLSYRIRTETLHAQRGSIYDRNNKPIAISVNSYDLGVHPYLIKNKVEVSNFLKNFVEKSEEEIYRIVNSNESFVFIERKLGVDEGRFIEEKIESFHGLSLIRTFERRNLIQETNHFIGKVDIDGNGIEGVELIFDTDLKGTDGSITYEAAEDGTRIPQGSLDTIEPQHGGDITLTIDTDLQFLASNQCKEAIIETKAERCSFILMNADDGEIYILVEEGESKILPIKLISVRGLYEPGSAFKIFTVGSILDKGEITSDTVFTVADEKEIIASSCGLLYEGIKGCYKDFLPHEIYDISVKEIIERSSNVGTINILESSNIDAIENFLEHFGFGYKTGVELSGEQAGYFSSNKKCKTCLAALSIGYSVQVTQMQMVKAYAIIANGGFNVEPTLIKMTENDRILPERVVNNHLASELNMLLINVVEGDNGTARSLRTEGVTIGGKTGTSRSYIEGIGYSESKYNTSFTGFFNTEKGPLVGSIILWNASTSPHSEYVTGGSTAAPIFGKIIESVTKKNILNK